ncbi:MAG: hypothetical protein A2V67_16120 [Deltaproteobacteria bacterium RBG_13_61_14]|nr:MAG: hypothetical protein A2V67_16120 [Deltaproteobacteria bacterium RBG_13_61_14]HXK37251.1 HAD family phosphatase [Candidatus Paceibacterota bacterium]
MHAKLKAIVFDYGQVLSYPEDPGRYDKMAAISGVDRRQMCRMYHALRPAYDRGEFKGTEYWRRIAALVGRTLSDAQVNQLIQEDTRNTTELNPQILSWVARLVETGFTAAILSNMTHDDMGRIAQHRIRESLGYFTVQLFSSEIGLVKPEEAIYRRCLAALGVSPRQVLFLDDKRENVAAARKVGMHAVRFRSFAASVPMLICRFGLPQQPDGVGTE